LFFDKSFGYLDKDYDFRKQMDAKKQLLRLFCTIGMLPVKLRPLLFLAVGLFPAARVGLRTFANTIHDAKAVVAQRLELANSSKTRSTILDDLIVALPKENFSMDSVAGEAFGA
jgi:hypothetical protein